MTVGKAYWKNVCMPSIIYGFNIIKINNAQINKLQIIENNIYRKILKAPIYTPVETLRGEIGSSQMKTRIIKGKIFSTGFWVRKDNKANGVLVVQHRAADHAQGIGCGSAYRRARSVGPLDSGPLSLSPGPDPLQVPPQTSPLLRGPVLGQTCPNR